MPRNWKNYGIIKTLWKELNLADGGYKPEQLDKYMNALDEDLKGVGIDETLAEKTIKKIREILEGIINEMLSKLDKKDKPLSWDGDYVLRNWHELETDKTEEDINK